MTHSATEPIVLELLYQLANVTPRRSVRKNPFPVTRWPPIRLERLIYYLLWPMTRPVLGPATETCNDLLREETSKLELLRSQVCFCGHRSRGLRAGE
jgi:hypothetical protein